MKLGSVIAVLVAAARSTGPLTAPSIRWLP